MSLLQSNIYAQILIDVQTSSIMVNEAVRGPCALLIKNAAMHTQTLSACVTRRKGSYAYNTKAIPCKKYNRAESEVMRYRLIYSIDSFSLKNISF